MKSLDALYRALRRVGGPLVALAWLFLLLPTNARADCSFDRGSSQNSPVNFAVAASITVPSTLTMYANLGNAVTATPSNPSNATCTNGTNYGVQNLLSSTPPTMVSGNYVYPTSVPGVGIELTHNSSPAYSMAPYPNSTTGAQDSTYSVSTTLQLVQTGPIAGGSVLPAGEFAYWQWGSITPEYFVLSNSVTFVSPSCTLDTSSISVVLPTVATSNFPAKDTVAGTTPFTIQLNCPTGSTTNATIKFTGQNGYPAGYANLLLKNTGNATGLGVELLDANSNSIVFGTATAIGPSQLGSWPLQYFAQYHSTSATVGAGTVKAVATFTITYN